MSEEIPQDIQKIADNLRIMRLELENEKQFALLRMKDDALDDFAEFYGKCIVAVGMQDVDANPSTEMDELILKYIEQGNQLVGVRAENARLMEALTNIEAALIEGEYSVARRLLNKALKVTP